MRRIFLALLLLVTPASAFAQACTAGAIDARQVGNDDYDPNEIVQTVVQISLRLIEDCELDDLKIVPRDSNNFALVSVGATLQSRQSDAPQTVLRNISETQLATPEIARLLNGEVVVFELLDLEPGQFVGNGNYQIVVNFVSDGQILGSQLITVIVRPTVRLLDDAASGNIDVDLGVLTDGVSTQKSIFFRANAQVSLLVTSDNGGTLVHERGNQFGSIPYTSSLNGAPINTRSPSSVGLSVVPGQLTETVFGVEVEPVEAAFAGLYRDVITFSFTAQ